MSRADADQFLILVYSTSIYVLESQRWHTGTHTVLVRVSVLGTCEWRPLCYEWCCVLRRVGRSQCTVHSAQVRASGASVVRARLVHELHTARPRRTAPLGRNARAPRRSTPFEYEYKCKLEAALFRTLTISVFECETVRARLCSQSLERLEVEVVVLVVRLCHPRGDHFLRFE